MIAVTGALRSAIAAAYAARAKGEKLLAGAGAAVRDVPFLAVASHAEDEDVVSLEAADEPIEEELEPEAEATDATAEEETEVTVEVEAPDAPARPSGPRRS